MAKAASPASGNFAAGVLASHANAASGQWQTAIGAQSVVPYAANVMWQDTSSNATYCSAGAALAGASRV